MKTWKRTIINSKKCTNTNETKVRYGKKKKLFTKLILRDEDELKNRERRREIYQQTSSCYWSTTARRRWVRNDEREKIIRNDKRNCCFTSLLIKVRTSYRRENSKIMDCNSCYSVLQCNRYQYVPISILTTSTRQREWTASLVAGATNNIYSLIVFLLDSTMINIEFHHRF